MINKYINKLRSYLKKTTKDLKNFVPYMNDA